MSKTVIRIPISNQKKFKEAYLKEVSDAAAVRLKMLKISIDHVKGPASSLDKGFKMYSPVTRQLVNMVRKPTLPKADFEKNKYDATMLNWQSGATAILAIDLTPIRKLADELSSSRRDLLDRLLTAKPKRLKKTVEELLVDYKIDIKKDKVLDVLKLAFDYSYPNVNDKITGFFRAQNLVTYCPYCNQDSAIYSATPRKTTADLHQLDHFFDKATNPLLAYSVFNLVPCDWKCNAINKHDNQFDDEFHLNPYTDGFGKSVKFIPLRDKKDEIQEIELSITVDRNSDRHKQLIGDNDEINEQLKHGNINVFKLKTKYNRKDLREEASKVLRLFLHTAKNNRSIHTKIAALGLSASFRNYKDWYEEQVRAPFQEKNFHQQRYSKLYRDLHDAIFEADTRLQNLPVQEIIKNYP
jgi:hypothetical protein